ncbi:hypothetical protein [Streptomyces sp. NPDC003077]|uniref:hypothetical protein n=1 Tax=Streptomyces sp. NPDC003077 TaxID=3154443 RepID=UPI0033AF497C
MITADDTGEPDEGDVRDVPLTRRTTVLAGAALAGAAVLAGCSDDAGERRGTGSEDNAAADRLRDRAARDSAALLAHYDATLAAHPALAPRLKPLRAEVAAHVGAFGGSANASPSASARQPSGRARPAPSPSASAPTVPEDAAKARAALADAERRTADARTAALADAPPELARLLASVAAAGAAHAYLLTSGGGA